jgi:hypothetical protein
LRRERYQCGDGNARERDDRALHDLGLCELPVAELRSDRLVPPAATADAMAANHPD